MNSTEMKTRTKAFALRTIKRVGALPRTPEAQAIARQLSRSGPSVGANYRGACRARSRADFIAKLGVVEEEADASAFWMELIMESGMLPENQVEPLHAEADTPVVSIE